MKTTIDIQSINMKTITKEYIYVGEIVFANKNHGEIQHTVLWKYADRVHKIYTSEGEVE
jgi:hypothetical protein